MIPHPKRYRNIPIFRGEKPRERRPHDTDVVPDASVVKPVANQPSLTVNQSSLILTDFSCRDPLPTFGTELQYKLSYGSKIYWEIYYDKNGTPLCARLRNDRRWQDGTVNIKSTAGGVVKVPSYPSEIILISKLDLSDTSSDIEKDIQSASSDVEAMISGMEARTAQGGFNAEEAAARAARLRLELEDYTSVMNQLQGSLSKFFSSGASKKQIRSFKLLAFTTKNPDPQLFGRVVNEDKDGGTKYKIVQTITSDLMIVPCCYRGAGCKTLIPWTRGIHDYQYRGRLEDDIKP